MIGKLIECAWHKLMERVIPFDDDVIERLIAEFVGQAGDGGADA